MAGGGGTVGPGGRGPGGYGRSGGSPDEGPGKKKIKTLLNSLDTRAEDMEYTEGRENWEPGEITSSENRRRLGLIKGYEAEDKMRAKIKPIKDPEGDKSTSRRKAARRKQTGRAGTLLSSRETLG